jgi:hypothetical protein
VKIKVVRKDADLDSKDLEVVKDFIKFLYKEAPIHSPITIYFLGNKIGDMTTGSRTNQEYIKVLSKGRMLIDVLRTLAHEWVHECQHQILGWEKGPDIGGRNEDTANSLSGAYLKMFQRDFPQHLEKDYE